MEQGKSIDCFHMSYNQPPNKSVVNDIMNKLSVNHKPFAFLVGDHPLCVLVTLLKAENPVKYHNIVPLIGPVYTQCSMISAIYKIMLQG